MNRNEIYYRSLFDSNYSVMLIIDPITSKIEDCNQAACSFYGYSYKEMLQLKISDINVLSKEQINRKMALAKEESHNLFYFKHKLSNQEIKEVEVSFTPIILEGKEMLFSIIRDISVHQIMVDTIKREKVNENNVIEGLTCFCTDVTKRIQSEMTIRKSEEKYRLLFQNAVEAIVIIQDQKIKMCNPMTEKLTGYNKQELSEMSFLDLIYEEDREATKEYHYNRLYGNIDKTKYIFRIVRKDGEIRIIETDGLRIIWNGSVAAFNFIMDITERKKAEEKLITSEEKYRLITENATDVIWVLNISKLKYTYISPSILQLRGITVSEALQESIEESMTEESYENIRTIYNRDIQTFLKNPDKENYYRCEIRQPRKDGKIIWVEISYKFQYSKSGDIEVIGVSRDIEERKIAEEKVLYLSYYDQLTSLHNRRYYEEEITKIDIEEELPITLIMADVNGLKLTNDAFGHNAGDELLRTIADILKKKAREKDIVARTGGDEFIMLLPNTDSQAAERIVDDLKNIMNTTSLNQMILSVSFGWATKTTKEESLTDIFTQAENFMYRRKLMESDSMKSEVIKIITKSLFEKGPYEKAHSERVGNISKEIGRALRLSTNEINDLGLLGLIHDIGKIGISETILNKPTTLDAEEWRQIKRHSETGYQILRSVNEFVHLAEYVLCHHERVDGAGYPKGLREEQIPVQSRILCIADAYESMTNGRSYKDAISKEEAINELLATAGTQFDRNITETFIRDVLKSPSLCNEEI